MPMVLYEGDFQKIYQIFSPICVANYGMIGLVFNFLHFNTLSLF